MAGNGVACVIVLFLFVLMDKTATDGTNIWNDLALPVEHLPYYFYSHVDIKRMCLDDPSCPYKNLTNLIKCWGYETNCEESYHMSRPHCPESAAYGWAKTMEEQVDKFWKSADYGYIKERLDELTVFCKPESRTDSYLACSKYTRYCQAKKIYLDFSNANLKTGNNRYREDVFKPGQIGGHCAMDRERLLSEGEHKSPLQSWFAELQEYQSLGFRPIEDKKCDVIINKPTILLKLDAGVNMYHHFCDFINLYASQHVNGSFSRDIFIVMWDTSPMSYGDFFHDSWKAFTDHPIISLSSWDNKKVCIEDAVFSLLARMRYGLYYNMPLIPGCYGSGLFRAFSQHFLHRLNITQNGPLESKIRVTLLARSTKFRKILNQEEVVAALKSVGELEVNVVDYTHKFPFLDQLQATHNSDIFLGMHGAGLTHMLFQPDWGVVFELYNCDDVHCYFDLSRLRGLRYLTWQNLNKLTQEDEGHHPTLGAHKKFTNYAFDIKELMQMVMSAVDYVKAHPRYQAAWKQKHSSAPVPEKEL